MRGRLGGRQLRGRGGDGMNTNGGQPTPAAGRAFRGPAGRMPPRGAGRGGPRGVGRGRQATPAQRGGRLHRMAPRGMEGRGGRLHHGNPPQNVPPIAITVAATTPMGVLRDGLTLVGFTLRGQNVANETNYKRFVGAFGVSPEAISACFNELGDIVGDLESVGDAHPKWMNLPDFLMAVNWLKQYGTESDMAGRWNLTEKTVRTKVRAYTSWIQTLAERKIKFEGFQQDEIFWISVDGVHCRIYEPRKDPSAKWYSHKSNSAGLTYEVGIAIRCNAVVWLRGPFPASQHDITTFRGGKKNEPKDEDALQFKLGADVGAGMGIGDSGYKGEPTKMSVTRSGDSAQVKEFKARVKSRHETFNSRLKSFGVLSQRFRHRLSPDLAEHKRAFEAVCVLCQFDLENNHGLFEV